MNDADYSVFHFLSINNFKISFSRTEPKEPIHIYLKKISHDRIIKNKK